MTYRYLIFGGLMVWGKHEMTKEYFSNAAQRGDIILDLHEMKIFNKDKNAWEDIEGDEA